MRKLLYVLLAAAALSPIAASAQSGREVRHDQREVRQDRREVRRDVRRGDYQEAREDRRELREDRRERNEDWRDYRRTHNHIYHRPAYVGPRGYRYRPVVIGFRFDPIYYSSRYWIANPWTYRLPAASSGLRWVRYGNDAVLVNVRTGQVVQVYQNFFW